MKFEYAFRRAKEERRRMRFPAGKKFYPAEEIEKMTIRPDFMSDDWDLEPRQALLLESDVRRRLNIVLSGHMVKSNVHRVVEECIDEVFR